ncbi:acyl-CoA dehydrogenase family protein [Sandarakinorhabdus sp. DWP1-3-1]|uniref:acyl-CoA dehydrogenase family protein n=1 Tax=Sandarakinorhabdus sp. DWP1-3-1 TaxID=2804627 RepID=UPI003CF72289
MSELRPQVVATAQALFAAAPGWPAIVAAGFPLLLVPESAGGFGGDWGDAFAVLQVAGAEALAQPLAEAMLAAHLVARAGVVAPHGLVTIGSGGGTIRSGKFTGHVAAVPWGRVADQVVATVETDAAEPVLLLLPAGAVTEGLSPAGEPRDRLDYRGVPAVRLGDADHALYGAFLRVGQSAGALAAALGLATTHVNARIQFGKPLAKLQAVQQSLAVLAEEVAAVQMAGAAAAAALDRGGGAYEMMAAKLRTNMAIHRGVALAHQVHGAIGFTQDYPLHRLTRRLMGWRSDFGGDSWAEMLGEQALSEPGAGLWADMVRRGDG